MRCTLCNTEISYGQMPGANDQERIVLADRAGELHGLICQTLRPPCEHPATVPIGIPDIEMCTSCFQPMQKVTPAEQPPQPDALQPAAAPKSRMQG